MSDERPNDTIDESEDKPTSGTLARVERPNDTIEESEETPGLIAPTATDDSPSDKVGDVIDVALRILVFICMELIAIACIAWKLTNPAT